MRAVSSEVLRRSVSQVSGDVRGASHHRHDGPSTRLPTFLRKSLKRPSDLARTSSEAEGCQMSPAEMFRCGLTGVARHRHWYIGEAAAELAAIRVRQYPALGTAVALGLGATPGLPRPGRLRA